MKKFIAIFGMLVAFLTLSSFAEDAPVPDKAPEKLASVQVVEAVSDEIQELSSQAYSTIQELASALQTPAEHVYKTLVRQSYLESLSWMLAWSVLWVASVGSIIFGIKLLKMEEDSAYPIITFSSIFAVLFIIFIIVCMPGLLNPEYQAMKEIMCLLR